MEIIPAIDLLGGKCVRLKKGEYRRKRTYSETPVAMARFFKAQGARRLRVVDLDGAREGKPKNIYAAIAIVRATRLPVQFSGGIRSLETVVRVLKGGIESVVLGTAAYAEPEFLKRALSRYGRRIMVSVDVRAGRVAVKGWRSTLGLRAGEAIRMLAKIGVKGILYTDTARDGTLKGVNFARLRKVTALCRKAGVFMHYAGGVRDIMDIRRLKRLDGKTLRGIVAGKSLFEGTLDLGEAVREVKGK